MLNLFVNIFIFLQIVVVIDASVSLSTNKQNDDFLQAYADKNAKKTVEKDPRKLEDSQMNSTNFEIKAVQSKCLKKKPCKCENSFQCDTKEEFLLNNDARSKYEEQADEATLENCYKKISFILKIKNKGITNCNPQYIVIDHIYDSMTGYKQTLLNPYVLKVTQQPVYQDYELTYEHIINAGPTEKVVNKKNAGFLGCNSDSIKPICTQHNIEEVPYNTGYCCSCLSNRNAFEEKSMEEANELLTLPLIEDNPNLDLKKIPDINLEPSHLFKRVAQDCDGEVPPNADPKTFHDSAHCLEFSGLWYSIYRIGRPQIEHSIKIEIFEKMGCDEDGPLWNKITKGGFPISIGTGNTRYNSADKKILAYYEVHKQTENDFDLEYKTHMLLIPESADKQEDYQEMLGGAEEYLVVPEKDIDISGKTCNKAGVGYEAFMEQPKKCDNVPNSCLKNQPSHMWKHDHDLEANGKKGCYFLKYFGCLPENPVRIKPCNSSKKIQEKRLYMNYLPCVMSIVNVEFAADMNTALKPDSLAIITEAYMEVLDGKKATITAKIFNSGLITSIFYVRVSTCPIELPASFSSLATQPVLIAPQHHHIFTLEIYCELPIKSFYCSLEAFNMNQQLVAIRRIRFEKYDRCICVWHCQCTCFLADSGLKCISLELQQYHAAGFQGGMPTPTKVINYSDLDDNLSLILHIILYFCLTLWYMGLFKAILGYFILPIGLWGLDLILDLPKRLNYYYEKELKDEKVVYDCDGWPVHPETGKKVNNMAPPTQFAMNMVFFFVYPFALLWNMCKNILGPKTVTSTSDLDICQCKASQISLVENRGLQNSLTKKSSSEIGRRNQKVDLKDSDRGQFSKNIDEEDDNKKKKSGCFPRRSKH
ncbi:unnamed protein product [Ceutorhynchus assimilis]|uniref:Generative cell specific-1/HAP2 domain-containing protein n=1 Tax=Ceutorhynchus assimilis TaxID=467358 RepID=A0A9N9MU99_9CUCU|nr:unnamed protein product [Ceutorhynchus assimilis]